MSDHQHTNGFSETVQTQQNAPKQNTAPAQAQNFPARRNPNDILFLMLIMLIFYDNRF